MSIHVTGMPKRKRTLAQRMIVLLAGAVFLSTGLIAGLTGWLGVRYLDQRLEMSIEDAFSSVRHNLTVFDRVLLSIEKQWESEIRENLPKLTDRLIDADRDFESYGAEELRVVAEEFGFSELYLINRDLRVKATSFEPDLELDMSQFTPEYTAYLEGLIGEGTVGVDRISPSTITGQLKKYAYFSAPGSEWIVNVDITVKQRLEKGESDDLGTFLYTDFVESTVTSDHAIKDVDLLILSEVDRWSLLHQGRRTTDEIGSRLFAGESIRIETGQALTIYRPIEFPSYWNPGAKIAASVTLDIEQDHRVRTIFISLVVGGAVLALALGTVLIIFIIRKIVTDRVDTIINGLEQAGEDRSLTLPVVGNDELATISSAVNAFVGRLSDQERELAEVNRSLESTIDSRTSELKKAMAETERANRARTNFFAMMTHELRTPLNAIIGFAQLLTRMPPEQRTEERVQDSAQTIETAGQHLLSIINNILDMSKIEAGRYELDLTDVDIGLTLAATRDLLRPLLENSGVEMEITIDQDPLIAQLDERSLRQVIVNLVSNAIKFSAPGQSVTVEASVSQGAFLLSVVDHGTGMTDAEIETAQEPFGQVRTESVLVRQEGSGLGLPTVKSLTELHGGTLSIKSTPGAGTTITIEIPQPVPE